MDLFKQYFTEARFTEVSNVAVSYRQISIIGVVLSLLIVFLLWRAGIHKLSVTLLIIWEIYKY